MAAGASSFSKAMTWAVAVALLLALLLAMAAPPVEAQCSNTQISSVASSCTDGGSLTLPVPPKSTCCPTLRSVGKACVCYLFKLASLPQPTVEAYYTACKLGYRC